MAAATSSPSGVAPRTAQSGATIPPDVPDHVLHALIGRGAYGEVWRATNVMGAPRAVKCVRRDAFGSEQPSAREFAALRHYEVVSRTAEGLVAVLHAGKNEAAGHFYYVMELADALGPDGADYVPDTLKARLEKGGPRPAPECLALATRLAQGLAALHGAGLLHRDVKPANVIFVHGQAKLADLGLVTPIDPAAPGTLLGTVGYLPPEGQGTPRADLHALGIVLYEALTGRAATEFPEVSAAWLGAAPPLAIELLEVALRAAEADPDRRHLTAEELLADLALIGSGRSAREVRDLAQRVHRLRQLGWAAVAAVGFGGSLLAWQRVRHDAELTGLERTAARAEAVAQRRHARIHEAAGLRRSGQLGDRGRAEALLSEAARTTTLPEERATLRDELAALWSRIDLRQLPPGRPCELSATLSPAGTAPCPSGRWRADLVRDGTVTLRPEGEDGPTLRLSVPERPVSALGGFNARGTHLFATLADGGIALWEVATQTLRVSCPGGERVLGAFSPTGNAFWHTSPSVGGVRIVDLSGAALSDAVEAIPGELTALAPSPDGHLLAVGWRGAEGEESVRLWDREAKHFTLTWPAAPLAETLPPPVLAWAPEGDRLAIAHGPSPIRVCRVAGEAGPLLFVHHRDAVVGLAWSPDGQHIASTDWGASTRVWSAATGEEETVVPEPGLRVAWSSDGSELVIDQAPTGPLRHVVRPGVVATYAPGGPPQGAIISPDGRWLATDGQDALVIHDVATRREVTRLPWPGVLNPVWPEKAGALFASSPSGVARWPVLSGPTGALRFGERETLSTIGGSHLVVSADGGTLAWGDAANTLRVLRRGAVEPEARGRMPQADQLVISRDGRWLSRVPWFGHTGLEVSDLTGGTGVWRVPPATTGGIFYTEFTPDGSALLSNDGRVGLLRWPVGSLVPQTILPPDVPRTARAGVAVSADGRLIAAQCALGQIALIEAASSRVLVRLEVPSHDFASGPLTLSSDGAWLVANSWQGFVHVWNLRELRSRLAAAGLDFELAP